MEPSSEQPPPSSGGLQRRPAAAARGGAPAPAEAGERGQRVIHGDVDPPPRPGPGMQMLAIAAIAVLGCLQFLPATHFRDPSDRRRNWIPFDSTRSSMSSEVQVEEVGGVDIFSWSDCLDLRVLTVLTNSTLSSSSDPESISFHFLMPEGGDDKLPYYKLKVVLPNSNITVTSQKEIKKKLNVATPEGNFLWSFHNELSPLLIATTHFSSKKYVYISPDTIVKGKIEDLAGIDLGTYAIGAVEDCSKRFGDYGIIEVLNAMQRTGAKSWVSDEPYDQDACLLDFNALLVEPRKLEKNLVESIMWWTKVVNVDNASDQIRLAIALAFYDKYLKLPSTWKRDTPTGNAANDEMNILNYDGPKNVCSGDGRQQQEPGHGNMWQQYLPQKSTVILTD